METNSETPPMPRIIIPGTGQVKRSRPQSEPMIKVARLGRVMKCKLRPVAPLLLKEME